VLTTDQARVLIESIDTSTLVGLRDRALIGVMTYAFARIPRIVAEYLREAGWRSARSARSRSRALTWNRLTGPSQDRGIEFKSANSTASQGPPRKTVACLMLVGKAHKAYSASNAPASFLRRLVRIARPTYLS
jgi:hypothetical protein